MLHFYFSSSIFVQEGRVQGLLGTCNFVILFYCYAFFSYTSCMFFFRFNFSEWRIYVDTVEVLCIVIITVTSF